jgi:elongation factor P hydroxylase
LDELEEEMKPDNKSYEKKIHQQIIDLIKNNFNLKVQKTS